MRKKIIIGIAAVAVLVIIGVAWVVFVENKKSPPKSASISNAGLDVSVEYSAPFKKGRLIFGEESRGALQPFGKYWRAGANAATQITFSKNVTFGGQPVNAGTYRMYAIPGPETWVVALNSEVGQWGYSEPDYSKDVLKATVPARTTDETEQFVINLANDSTSVMMDLVWDKTLVRVPIAPQ